MIFIFFFTWLTFSSSAYEMEIINDFSQFPATGDVFKVPYKNDYLMCVANDKRKAYSKTNLSIPNIFQAFTKGCRGFKLGEHLLIFCYNQTCKYDNIVIGNKAKINIENKSIVYRTDDGDKCVENGVNTTYKFVAKFTCDPTIPKTKMECPAFWKVGNCTVETVLKTSDVCKHPAYKSKGFYNIKCINRRTFEKELNRMEEN